MKNPKHLPVITCILGLLCTGSSLWLQCKGREAQGLYVRNHPAIFLLLALCAIAALVILLQTKDLRNGGKYAQLFPASPIAAAGTLAAAVGMLLCVRQELSANSALNLVCGISGIAGGVALAFLAWCRLTGRHPNFLLRSIVLLHLSVHLLLQYQNWIPKPQLTDYAFPLLASVCLVLACYHRTAYDAGMGNKKAYVRLSLLAAFFCFGAAVFSHDRIYYISMLAQAITDLPSLKNLSNPD